MTGPLESERDAHAAALLPPRPGWSILSQPQNRAMLVAACESVGLELGAYDLRILGWLAGFEDSTCAVVARVGAPGQRGQVMTGDPAEEAEQRRQERELEAAARHGDLDDAVHVLRIPVAGDPPGRALYSLCRWSTSRPAGLRRGGGQRRPGDRPRPGCAGGRAVGRPG